MAKMPTAAVEKVGLQFSKNVFTDVAGPERGRLAGGRTSWDVIVGGPFVVENAKEGKPALIQYALDAIKDLFGGDPAKHLVRSNSSTWWTDPYSLGAYSYVGPGDVPARAAFAQPLDDQLFFAGEHCAVVKHSSIVGAWETAERTQSRDQYASGIQDRRFRVRQRRRGTEGSALPRMAGLLNSDCKTRVG